MKNLKRLSFVAALMFLMASCELTQAPLEFDKDPGTPIDNGGPGDETGGPVGPDGPPD